jgi:hypothetical protein
VNQIRPVYQSNRSSSATSQGKKRRAAPATLDDFSLRKRGWTLQEDIRAVRTVHYSGGGIRWECQNHRKAESVHGALGGYDLRPLKYLFLRGLTNNVTGGSWYKIVESYMPRELTRPEDMFAAISGIAREISRQTGFTYRAGIWLEDFHRGLLWAFHWQADRSDSYVAPTWSWGSIKTIASLASHTIYRYKADEDVPDIRAKLLNCDITPRKDDPFGQITHATITLRGLWLPLSEWRSRDPILMGMSWLWPRPKHPWSIECNFDEPLTHPDWCSMEDTLFNSASNILQNLYLLQIAILPRRKRNTVLACHFLILRPATTLGEYQRVGVGEASLRGFPYPGDWKWRDVTII